MDQRDAVRNAYSSMSKQYIELFDSASGSQAQEEHAALFRRHLTGLSGPVLDLGCGPGHWTAHLHSWGAEVTGVDMVPEFIEHARAAHPGPAFQLGSMTEVDVPEHSVAGILSWYSTIHLPPTELDLALAEFRRLLMPSGTLVVGFFDSDDEVAEFDHAVTTGYRWPVEVLARCIRQAGFTELERSQQQFPERPDRKYATIVARAD